MLFSVALSKKSAVFIPSGMDSYIGQSAIPHPHFELRITVCLVNAAVSFIEVSSNHAKRVLCTVMAILVCIIQLRVFDR